MANRYHVFYYTACDKRSRKFVKKYGKTLQRAFAIVECVDEIVAPTGTVPKRYYPIRKMTLPVFQYYDPDKDALEYHYAADGYNFAKHYMEQATEDPDSDPEEQPFRRPISLDQLAELQQQHGSANPFAEPFKSEETGSANKLSVEELNRLSQANSRGLQMPKPKSETNPESTQPIQPIQPRSIGTLGGNGGGPVRLK